MVSLFYLFCTYITPDENTRETFFVGLERQRRTGKTKHDRGSLRWFYGIWFFVFQVLPSRVITLAATEFYEARACPLSKKLTDSRAAISAVQAVSTATCLLAVLMFYGRLKTEIGKNHCVTKLAALKVVVFVTITQQLIFSILQAEKVLKPSETVSYLDITIGVPAFMTCCEMFLFSLFYLWAFWPSSYIARTHGQGAYVKHGFWRGLWEVVNVWDIISGVFFRYRLLWTWPSKKESNKPVGMPIVGGLTVIRSPDSDEDGKESTPEEMGSQPSLPEGHRASDYSV
jgi:hypothetical protein